MDYNEIKQRLPHEAPYILLDRILSLNSDSVVALKNISGGEWFTQSHYPNKAVYPGVLLVEMAAQAAALLMGIDAGESSNVPLLGGINRFHIQRTVEPGDQLIIKIELIKRVEQLAMVSVLITCDEQVVVNGQLSFGEKRFEEI